MKSWIGMGAGWHCKLAREVGFEAFGLDISLAGLEHAGEPLPIRNSSGSGARVDARTSWFEDRGVAASLSYGVFYDRTADEMKQAILEVNRVLISDSPRQGDFCPPYGEDSGVGKGEKLDHNTLRLIITIRTSTKGFSISSPPKRSRTMSRTMSRCFRVWPFEKTETIFGRPHRRKFRLADHGGEVMKRAREVVGGTQLVPERAGWTPEAIGVVSKTVGGKREFMKPRDGAKEVLRARCRRDGRNP